MLNSIYYYCISIFGIHELTIYPLDPNLPDAAYSEKIKTYDAIWRVFHTAFVVNVLFPLPLR